MEYHPKSDTYRLDIKDKWIESLQQRIEELMNTLVYYANDENRDEKGRYGNYVGTAIGDNWELDEGKIAQNTLEEKD